MPSYPHLLLNIATILLRHHHPSIILSLVVLPRSLETAFIERDPSPPLVVPGSSALLREAFQQALTDWPPVLRYSKQFLHGFYYPTIKESLYSYNIRSSPSLCLRADLQYRYPILFSPNPRAAKKVTKGKKEKEKKKKKTKTKHAFPSCASSAQACFFLPSFLLVAHLAPTHPPTHTPPPRASRRQPPTLSSPSLFPPTLPPAPPIINLLDYPSLRSLRFGVSVKRQPPASSAFSFFPSFPPLTTTLPQPTHHQALSFSPSCPIPPSTHFFHA